MENIMSKINDRIKIAKEIYEFSKDGLEGDMEINGVVTILFNKGKVYHITFNNGVDAPRDFNLAKFSEKAIFTGIMAMPNITESVLVEEVYKSCLMVNKKHSKENPSEE